MQKNGEKLNFWAGERESFFWHLFHTWQNEKKRANLTPMKMNGDVCGGIRP